MVSQNGGRSNPFATGGSSNGYVDRSSLRTSQDISVLLRSGMLMEAALLSSNASRMHVIHDAGGLVLCRASGWKLCVWAYRVTPHLTTDAFPRNLPSALARRCLRSLRVTGSAVPLHPAARTMYAVNHVVLLLC
jgi:hypothetical protein